MSKQANEENHPMVRECIERLVNIENKVNRLLDNNAPSDQASHPDQYFGGRTYSQHGDDLIVTCLFQSMGIQRPSYLDIGAHHPENISNTALLHKRGSRGINVEPNPNLYSRFVELRKEDVNLNVGASPSPGTLTFYMIDDFSGRNTFSREAAEAFVRDNPSFKISKTMDIPVMTIDGIVERYANGVYPDFLTIDVEGLDEQIISSANFSQSKPKVICIEVDNACGNNGEGRIKALLESRGFYCVIRAVGNLIFVDAQYRNLVC